MRVCVVNAYNRRNAGDAALLGALLHQVRAAFPGVELAYSGLEDPGPYPDFDGVTNLGSIRRWAGDENVSRRRRRLRKFGALILVLLPAPLLRVAGRRGRGRCEPLSEVGAIADADLVVGLGGGYLNGEPSAAGTLNVFFLVLPILLAERMGRPVVLAPQSYGPFGGRVQAALTRRALNATRHLEVREEASRAMLTRIGVRTERISRGVDSAFATTSTPDGGVTRFMGRTAAPLLGVTVRDFLPPDDQRDYERAIAGFIDWAQIQRGLAVVLLPQVVSDYQGDDDRVVACRVAALCQHRPRVIDGWTHYGELWAMYGELDYVVGTRFHSVIFSLLSGVPALAVEYEHKTSGIMRDLGLERWVLAMHGLRGDELSQRFDELMAERTAYLHQLNAALPNYRLRADAFTDRLQNLAPAR